MIAATLLLSVAVPSPAMPAEPTVVAQIAPAQAGRVADVTAVQQVMERFHAAVVAHDGASLLALFTPDAGLFNVLTDQALTQIRSKTPTAPKARWSSARQFSDFVTSSHAALNPVHTELSVRTDGTIATAWFNFVFLIDGKPENRGSETWQLVKTADGWRIASISYSSLPRVA